MGQPEVYQTSQSLVVLTIGGLFSKGKRGLPGERISERGPSQELVEIFAGMPLVTK